MSGKKKKSVKIIILTIACFLIGSATYLFEEAPADTGRYYIENSGGAVVFEHDRHSEQAESCADCHHPLFSVTEMTTCDECHDDDFMAEDFDHEELKEVEDHQCSVGGEQAIVTRRKGSPEASMRSGSARWA